MAQLAADTLDEAAALAPDEPSFWDHVGTAWSGVWHEVADAGVETGSFIASLGNAMLHHPDIILEVAAGVGMMFWGAITFLGGGALSITGVRAVAGVPAAAAGAAVAAAGAGVFAQGLGRGITHATGHDAVQPLTKLDKNTPHA